MGSYFVREWPFWVRVSRSFDLKSISSNSQGNLRSRGSDSSSIILHDSSIRDTISISPSSSRIWILSRLYSDPVWISRRYSSRISVHHHSKTIVRSVDMEKEKTITVHTSRRANRYIYAKSYTMRVSWKTTDEYKRCHTFHLSFPCTWTNRTSIVCISGTAKAHCSPTNLLTDTHISKNWYAAYFFWEDSIEIEERKGVELSINMIDMPWKGIEALLFILRYALEKDFYRITLLAILQKEVPHMKRREKILIQYYNSFWFKNDTAAPHQALHPLILDLLDEKVLTILIRTIEKYRESGKWEGFPIWFSPWVSLSTVKRSISSE